MNHALLRATVHAQTALVSRHHEESQEHTIDDQPHAPDRDRRTRQVRDAGQATTEYALVLLGAAAVALLVVTWATAGGGAGRIGRLFDRVIDAVLGQV